MSTATIDRPAVIKIPAQPVGEVAADGTVTFFAKASTTVANAARTAGTWVREGLRTFKLDSLADALKDVAGWVLGKVRWGLTRIAMLGKVNLVGATLTCGAGRDALGTVLGATYRFASKVVLTALRPVAWGLRKVRLGKVVDLTTGGRMVAEITVQHYFGRAMSWMDAHEHSTAMAVARRFFQISMWIRLVRLFLPRIHPAFLLLIVLFVPVFGARDEVIGEPAAAEVISLVKDQDEVLVHDTAVDRERILVRALQTRGGFKSDLIYNAVRVTDHRGEVWIELPGDEAVLLRDLDTKMWEIGTVQNPLPAEERLLASVAEASKQVAQGSAPKSRPQGRRPAKSGARR